VAAPDIHMDIYNCDSVEWRRIVDILDRHLKLADW
jgi:hypothetical protein